MSEYRYDLKLGFFEEGLIAKYIYNNFSFKYRVSNGALFTAKKLNRIQMGKILGYAQAIEDSHMWTTEGQEFDRFEDYRERF